jgi:hypothetical protein
MPPLIQALDTTTATRWRERLWGGVQGSTAAKPKGHRLTKEAYYRAVIQCLAAEPGSLPKWTDVVARVPNGARATFYSVAGPKAAHPLLGEYLDKAADRQREIGECYRRGEAVAWLIDEAKVWTYWMYRAGWTHELRLNSEPTPEQAAANLVSVLAQWATTHKRLAGALSAAPPICAVEDFSLIYPERAIATAIQFLTNVVGEALGPLGTTAGGVLEVVRGELEPSATRASSDRRSGANGLVARLAETLDALSQELRTFPPAKTVATRRLAIELLKDAIDDLESVDPGDRPPDDPGSAEGRRGHG